MYLHTLYNSLNISLDNHVLREVTCDLEVKHIAVVYFSILTVVVVFLMAMIEFFKANYLFNYISIFFFWLWKSQNHMV